MQGRGRGGYTSSRIAIIGRDPGQENYNHNCCDVDDDDDVMLIDGYGGEEDVNQ